MSPAGGPAEPTDVTSLLARWQAGEDGAHDRVAEVVYPELRRIAAAYLRRERSNHTLQPTALVHEAFLRLVDAGSLRFDCRQQFFALAAQLMRHILVDHARAALAQKRGGDAAKVSLEGLDLPDHQLAAGRFLELHDALDRLADHDPRKARIIELRYFGGLTLEEAAEVLGISRATAHREQRFAEAWLSEALSG
jgi:RNA polymerase sigma-70 factor (ECF subfamily)